MKEIEQEKSVFEFLRNYWFVVVLIATLIIAYANNGSDHKNFESRLSAVEVQSKANNDALNSMKNDITQIKTMVGFIGAKLGVPTPN